MLPFSLKESQQANPLQVPQRGLYGEKYPLTGHFYPSLNICLFTFPSESPVREPPPCSLTGSPWAAILRHQSHWSTFHSFIHSCMSARVPRKETSYIHMGKNIRSPSTEPHEDGRPTCSGVRPGSPRGSLRHCYLYIIPSTLAWVDQSLLAKMCCGNPLQSIPSITVTASHVTQGRAEYKSTIPRGRDKGLDLWKAMFMK